MSSSPIVAQIVQHLAPGGIETMALDLQRKSDTPENIHIISLEGNHLDSVASWPRIKQLERIHFLDKQPGLSTSTVTQLYQLLKKLNVDVMFIPNTMPGTLTSKNDAGWYRPAFTCSDQRLLPTRDWWLTIFNSTFPCSRLTLF